MDQRTPSAHVEEYLEDLGHELVDLPPQEVAAVLEDVKPQLLELSPQQLTELGPPSRYAAELRDAAGYEGETPSTSWAARLSLVMLVVVTMMAAFAGMLRDQVVTSESGPTLAAIALALLGSLGSVWHLGPAVRDVAPLPEVRTVRRRLPVGVVRYLAVVAPGLFMVSGVPTGYGGYLITDRLGWGAGAAEVFGVVVGVLVVVIGHRTLRDRRWLWLSVPFVAYALGMAIRLLIQK
jgi:hypothetical protein